MNPKEAVTAEAGARVSELPASNGGVVIMIENDVSAVQEAPKEKAKGKKRRNCEPDVQLINGPTVRFPEFLNRPPPIQSTMLDLRKHVMVAQINYYNASTRFFDQAAGIIPHVKRLIADMPSALSKREAPSTSQAVDLFLQITMTAIVNNFVGTAESSR